MVPFEIQQYENLCSFDSACRDLEPKNPMGPLLKFTRGPNGPAKFEFVMCFYDGTHRICTLNSLWPSDAIWQQRSGSTLAQVMAWCCQATSHYLSQCWPRSLLPYGVTRPQWVKSANSVGSIIEAHHKFKFCGSTGTHRICTLNSLWPSDAIWQQRSGSTLAQVMACCLTAPSHYLNQCWLIYQ